ncbi:transglutaminase domain-containing protein [Winogradskyella sp.]|uniref:transglutaminase domain-containing protein n=1 Tax=Winogradskyella sp. TaxID=1883156 RepID=UPI00261CB06C|nr:transglutaminase domain-containing protein [Winogradskyella sp.]
MKYLITIALSLLFFVSNAQNIKFGNVSKAELQQKVHPKDSTANAAVIYRKEYIYFIYTDDDGFMQHREIHERIKIYNKQGFDLATEKIYLYEGSGGNKEKLLKLKGYTYNLTDGKIEKEKLKKEGIFEEDYNEFTEINTITMPNIKEGSVIEYSYKIVSPFLVIDDVVFQYNIPINKFDLEIKTPEYYVYDTKVNPKAFYYPNIKTSTSESKGKYTATNQAAASNLTSGSKGYSQRSFDYKENVLSANEVDIPALKVEAYAGSLDNYRAKLTLELSAILNSYGGIEKSFSTDWNKVCKSILADSDFGDQLSRSNFFKNDIQEVVAMGNDDFQKALLLQSFVKSKVKWNGFYGYTAMKGTKKAYNEGEGNVADINLLLIAMMRSQGISASPVLVSTRDNGIPVFPTRKGFNYVICMVESDQGYVLLDATEPYSMINVLPSRTLNWQGRVLKDDGYSSWVSLRPTKQSSETTSLNIKINEDFSIEGKIRQSITDHLALSYRKSHSNLSTEDHIKRLENGKGDIEISNLEFENDMDITKPIKISYDYEASDAIDEVGGNLYFSPLLFFTMDENPFKLETREYPIDFAFPFKDSYLVNIMLPEGYAVESLPKSEIFEFNGGESKFKYIIKQNGSFLQLSIELNLGNSLIKPNDYSVFKQFFNKVVEKQSEQIVLKKA